MCWACLSDLLEAGDDEWRAEDSVSHLTLPPLDDVIVLPGTLLMQQIQRNLCWKVKGSSTGPWQLRMKDEEEDDGWGG